MSNFEEKAGSIEHKTPNYTWSQTIEEVTILVDLPEGTRGRDLTVRIQPKRLHVALNRTPSKIYIDGELFGSGVQPKESLWTIEDNKVLRIALSKVKRHETWKSVIVGEHEIDELQAQEVSKKMMLERFQGEHPGFDFSGAEFTGQVPQDPANFLKFD